MKVRVSYVVDVSEDFRRAIREYYGLDGLASRDEVKQWFYRFGDSMTEDVLYDLRSDDED